MKILGKIIMSIFSLIICLMPVWIFIGGRSLLSPEGFFQEFFVFGVGVWFLGGVQAVLFIFFIVLLVFIWNNKIPS